MYLSLGLSVSPYLSLPKSLLFTCSLLLSLSVYLSVYLSVRLSVNILNVIKLSAVLLSRFTVFSGKKIILNWHHLAAEYGIYTK